MSLFQRRPIASDPKSFYTLGLNQTVLIVGLGNPGEEYDHTRHNIGFAAVDAFVAANNFPAWIQKKDLKCMQTVTTLGQTRTIVIKPTTFMNLSGEAVAATMNFYKLSIDKVLVVHDELDIDFGQIRTRQGGSAAGHNGIKSIIEHGGENFARARIGIGPKTPAAIDSADFVLKKFTKKELEHLPELTREASAILSEYTYSGGQLNAETRSFLL